MIFFHVQHTQMFFVFTKKKLLLFRVFNSIIYIIFKSEISNAWPVFCPALPSNTPTIAPGLTTAPTEVFPTSMPTPTVTGESTPDGGTNIDDIMCSFCNPDGVEFPDLILPTDDGTTCTIASEYAATLLANDVMCPTVLMAEALCCPNNSGGEGTDDEPRPEPCEGNIVDVAMENEDFTTLVEAVTAAGLVDELSGEGPFTVFGTSFFFVILMYTRN